MHRNNRSQPGAAIVAIALLVSFSVTACKDDGANDHDNDHSSDEGAAIGTPSGAECPQDGGLTYDTFGKGFMDKYCVRCHSSKLKGAARNGATEGHDFDLLAGIMPVAEHIDEYAAAGPDAVNVKMPATDPKPTEEERHKLGEWLACEVPAP